MNDITLPVDIVRTLLKDTHLADDISFVEGSVYLLHYTEDSCPKEQWDNYIDVQDTLRDVGLQLDDPYTEHDCISGNVIYNTD